MPIPSPRTRFGATFLGGIVPTGLKLVKLHGSLSWYYTGREEAPGGLIYETAGSVDFKWNAASLVWPPDERRYFADLQPMVLPPTAVKSPYYSNKMLQANWKHAAEETSNAEKLI
jgi:hypothetical protein